MTLNIKGDPLWKSGKVYSCGCKVIEGEKVCPRHGKPIMEMIYGTGNVGNINEQDKYEKQNLNE